MPKEMSYARETAQKRIVKLRAILSELPAACADFLDGISETSSTLTRLAYAYDLRIFFHYAVESIPACQNLPMTELTDVHMQRITVRDLERYQQYLSLYERPEGVAKQQALLSNSAAGKMRKLASLRSFYKYMFERGRLSANITDLIPLPVLHEKPIIRLEVDEIAKILDAADSGDKLTGRQKRYNKQTRVRDLAILSLLLGTGIRVSECVGMDLGDVDLEENAFRVTRKGGDQVILYFSDEVAKTLKAYRSERIHIQTLPGHEQAFFLSLQKRRITQRAIQLLTKKYAAIAAPLKKISPHKLRSTIGTQLYNESGDIYLVADVLGHSDVNTTRKHYAAMSEGRRRRAATLVKLRDDPEGP
ncbi:MAG TPA: tyrosine-type recombinase/integrase [Clostridia bacterium]|nr:tyrosine-type recombinase/integrase [Clostridia bacterium]